MKARIRILLILPLVWGFLGLAATMAQKPKTSETPTATAPTDQKCVEDNRINPNIQCERVYEPVCGCNGRTYSNVCDAERNGVLSTHTGACPGSLQQIAFDAVSEWENAYNEGNASKLESTFATDASMVSPYGTMDGRKTIGGSYKKTFADQEGKLSLRSTTLFLLRTTMYWFPELIRWMP
ncbi:MAG: hypothetical protein IPJ40_04770 [Saprospirales bacterium]|nr:hypothetical protein [Saprospirales bacterium]